MSSILIRMALTTVFAPASFMFETTKKAIRMGIAPVDWIIKKVNPNYVNDVTAKKDQIKTSLKNKADQSILTMSSFVAK